MTVPPSSGPPSDGGDGERISRRRQASDRDTPRQPTSSRPSTSGGDDDERQGRCLGPTPYARSSSPPVTRHDPQLDAGAHRPRAPPRRRRQQPPDRPARRGTARPMASTAETPRATVVAAPAEGGEHDHGGGVDGRGDEVGPAALRHRRRARHARTVAIAGVLHSDHGTSPSRAVRPPDPPARPRRTESLRPATWDEALQPRRRRARARRVDAAGPSAVGFFSCSKSTNEMNFIAQKFARAVDRHQQHRLLQPHLTRALRGRSGHSLRSRRWHLVVRRGRGHRRHRDVGVERP